MLRSINVIGSGRVGSAVSARLRERDISLGGDGDLVLLCVPDSAIADVARTIEPGPWLAHVSGATPLSDLEPHRRRFSLHPLQTFTRARGPEQLDGAWAAITSESAEARSVGFWAVAWASRSTCSSALPRASATARPASAEYPVVKSNTTYG